MAEYFVIRLGAAPENGVGWIVVDNEGTRRSPPSMGSLAESAAAVRGRPVIVLVPAIDCVTMTVKLPIRSAVKLQAALPYALEEQLAADVDTLHFAAGPVRGSGVRPVAIIARDKLDGWLALLDSAGIQPWQVVPENYGVARVPGTCSLLIDNGCLMFNDGGDREFAMEGVKPSDVLVTAGILSEKHDEVADEHSGHLVAWCGAEDDARLEHDWIALRHEMHSVDVNLLPDGALPRLAVTVAFGNGVNLLQGRYGPKADYGSWVRPWRTAAMLVLGLAMLGFVAKGVDIYRMTQEETALKSQFASEFQVFRPGSREEILDPVGAVSSIRRSLGAETAPAVFLASLVELANAVRANEAADVESLSYRAGVVDVRLTAPDVATLDSIQKAVSESGRFQASIQSTDQVGDRISSRIQVKEAGS